MTDDEKKEPEDFIMNPILAIHTQVDDLNIEVNNLKSEVNKNTQLLTGILERDTEILKEARDRRPKGKVMRRRGTAPTDNFFIIDTNKDPGHKIRSYSVINEGPNAIFVGFNVAFSPQLDASIEDLVSDEQRFDRIDVGQFTNDGFDTEEIMSIHIVSDPTTGLGPSTFKAKLVW